MSVKRSQPINFLPQHSTKKKMELYTLYFAALALFNVALTYHRHQSDKRATPKESLDLPAGDSNLAATRFKHEYLGFWALVIAADWLQVGIRLGCGYNRLHIRRLIMLRNHTCTLCTETRRDFQSQPSQRCLRQASSSPASRHRSLAPLRTSMVGRLPAYASASSMEYRVSRS